MMPWLPHLTASAITPQKYAQMHPTAQYCWRVVRTLLKVCKFVLYHTCTCNFWTNCLKLIKVYISRKDFLQGTWWWCWVLAKNHTFWENHKKLIFWPFGFPTNLKITFFFWKNGLVGMGILILNTHSHVASFLFLFFWILAYFLIFMPNKVKK